MTTDQKIEHVRWYIKQIQKSSNRETKLNYIHRGGGALGAWFADMTLSHEHFNMLNAELDAEWKLILKEV